MWWGPPASNGANFANALEEVRERLEGRPLALTIPIGSGSIKDSQTPFEGVIQGAYSYIQDLLAHLNSTYDSPSEPDAFGGFPDQSSAASGDSSVVPYSAEGYACYNFAVARVRLSGTPGGSSEANVRVLFRLFAAETSDTARLLCVSNQPVTVAIMGAKIAEAAMPTSSPKTS